MSDNLELYEKVRAVPSTALKTIAAGRLKGFSDVNPMWRIKTLTEHFGMCGIGWYVEEVNRELVTGSEGQKVAFVSLNLFIKVDGEWSKPILGEGGSSFVANESRGPYTSDEAFKMAYTDAISICCKMLGFGADVYFSKDSTKYSENAPQQDEAAKDLRPDGKAKEWLNRIDKEGNVLKSYLEVIEGAKEKEMSINDLRAWYKISKEVSTFVEQSLKQ